MKHLRTRADSVVRRRSPDAAESTGLFVISLYLDCLTL